jgi:hypothetical protein
VDYGIKLPSVRLDGGRGTWDVGGTWFTLN